MLKKRAASFWLTAMFYTMLQRVSLFVFGVTAYMILVRGFSTETNGIWALYVTLYSLFEAVKQGLIRNASIRFLHVAEYADKRDAVQSSSLLINTIFSLLIIALVFLSGNMVARLLHAPALLPLLLTSTLIILLLIPFNHCEILLQSKFRFDVLFRAAFIRQGIFFAGLVVLYFFYFHFFTLINVLLLQVLALAVAVVYIIKSTFPVLIKKYTNEPGLTLKIFHFGKYTFGTNLFAGLSRSFDHFITAGTLNSPMGKDYIAYYNTVARINNMVDVPALAAADVLYPKNVEAHETVGIEKVKYYFEQIIGTILAFIIPLSLFIFVFPKLVIFVIAGPQYYPAVIILQLTILFSMVRPLSYQFGSTLDAIGKPHINFWANAGLMATNLLLTYTFIKLYGGIGAAYATMIYYSLSFFVMLFILKKYLRIELKNIIRYGLGRYKDFYNYIKMSFS
jgi:lipopolysaccharide exporter